jgi:hypothetical protein
LQRLDLLRRYCARVQESLEEAKHRGHEP